MPNETMIKLGLLSKKSPVAVESVYNALMDQMKKSNAIYKAYDIIPEANVDAKSKKYGEFMAVFMKELKKKLGIDVKLEVEGYTPQGVIMESDKTIKVWSIFTWKDRNGRVDKRISKAQRYDFEKHFNGVWNDYPEEIDTDGFNVEYKMTKEQYDWCMEKYSEYFTLEPDEIVEEVGSVSTASMGSPTTADGSPAPYGNSAIYADRMSMTSRGGQVGMPKPLKKKKKVRESIDYVDTLLEAWGYYGGHTPSKRSGRDMLYWDEPPEGGWNVGKPISPLEYYQDEDSNFKIRLNMDSPYVYNKNNDPKLIAELEKSYPNKFIVGDAIEKLLRIYFFYYGQAVEKWLRTRHG